MNFILIIIFSFSLASAGELFSEQTAIIIPQSAQTNLESKGSTTPAYLVSQDFNFPDYLKLTYCKTMDKNFTITNYTQNGCFDLFDGQFVHRSVFRQIRSAINLSNGIKEILVEGTFFLIPGIGLAARFARLIPRLTWKTAVPKLLLWTSGLIIENLALDQFLYTINLTQRTQHLEKHDTEIENESLVLMHDSNFYNFMNLYNKVIKSDMNAFDFIATHRLVRYQELLKSTKDKLKIDRENLCDDCLYLVEELQTIRGYNDFMSSNLGRL